MKIIKSKYRKKQNQKKKTRKQKGGSNNFGFIFTRCVKKKEDNQIWINCYKSIRKFYKEKILIITDGSNKEFIDNMPLENVELVDSEFPGAGEVLPYYYFNKVKPFKKAICMQDSMWFVKKFDFENYYLKDVVFLWHMKDVPYLRHYKDKELELATLTNNQEVIDTYKNKEDWIASWGGCSFITIDFLEKLENKYHFLKFVNIMGKERSYRHSFERIFGLICYLLSETIKEKPSLFGANHQAHSRTNLKNINTYTNINTNPSSYMMKLFRGR